MIKLKRHNVAADAPFSGISCRTPRSTTQDAAVLGLRALQRGNSNGEHMPPPADDWIGLFELLCRRWLYCTHADAQMTSGTRSVRTRNRPAQGVMAEAVDGRGSEIPVTATMSLSR